MILLLSNRVFFSQVRHSALETKPSLVELTHALIFLCQSLIRLEAELVGHGLRFPGDIIRDGEFTTELIILVDALARRGNFLIWLSVYQLVGDVDQPRRYGLLLVACPMQLLMVVGVFDLPPQRV